MDEPGAELVPSEPGRRLDTHLEVALDEVPEPAPPVPVDPAVPYAVLPADGERKQIVPAPLRSVEAAKLELQRLAGREWHKARWHGLRSPVYLARALAWALAGLLKVIGRQIAWWWVAEYLTLSREAVTVKDSSAWLSMHKHVREVRLTRGSLLAAELLFILAATVAMWQWAPWWSWPLVAFALLFLFARVGKPPGAVVITPAVVTPRFRVLRADIVLRAYYAAGLGHPEKPGLQVTFGSAMSRDGEGTGVLVDLPHGKGLKDAVDAKDRIASGLDVTESQVFLRRDPTSYRRHTLWVADRDPLAVPVGRTPLLACRQTDIWKPAPAGLDERGQLVTVPVMWNSVLVGALPRQGKTFAARLLGLYLALDPYVKLSVFDAKGSPDWRKFALVADSCAFGLTPTKDGLPPEILLATLNELKADVQERYHKLSELEARRPDLCPEGKLTRKLARDPRFNMPARVIVLDEVQEYYDLGDISKEIAPLLVFLAKVAPGAGVSVIASTQKPSGIGTGQIAQHFISFRDQMQIRFSLRTSSWQVSEMVLGQGALSEGLDSSTLLPQYKGVGILRGATDANPTVRTYLADGQDAERILTAARAIRERAGTLTGMAAGAAPQAEVRDVLGDVLGVFGSDPGLHWATLAERLAAAFPSRWEGATADSVSAECRAAGVPSVTVKVAGLTLRGCRLEDIRRAAAG
jgi:S-DNA-T family DNA segregation ATPase FtsK/SpoIIIE